MFSFTLRSNLASKAAGSLISVIYTSKTHSFKQKNIHLREFDSYRVCGTQCGSCRTSNQPPNCQTPCMDYFCRNLAHIYYRPLETKNLNKEKDYLQDPRRYLTGALWRPIRRNDKSLR